MKQENPHQAITMHRIRFDWGIAGLVFAIACLALLFLFGNPDYWQLFAGAIALGLLIAIILRLQPSAILCPPDDGSANHEYPHPGINMHQIRFGRGFAALVFTAGCMALFLFGTPGLWIVFPAAILLGFVIAAIFHFVNR